MRRHLRVVIGGVADSIERRRRGVLGGNAAHSVRHQRSCAIVRPRGPRLRHDLTAVEIGKGGRKKEAWIAGQSHLIV